MAAGRAYLDYNASVPLRAGARAAMLAALDVGANPSSVHREGRGARALIEAARRDVAALAGANPSHVVFTSGATEAATTLLTPRWRMGRAELRLSRLYVCEADHPCLLGGGRFAETDVVRIGVDGNGLVDLAGLRGALLGHDRSLGLPLVAIHAVNNETGVLQPVREIAGLAKDAGAIVVFDAVQAFGRLDMDIAASGADFLIMSSHKLGGPMGAGAIVGASDLTMPQPLVTGGGQERGHRAGTENLAAIAGFGAAAREALAERDGVGRIGALRDRIEQIIRDSAPDAVIFGRAAPRIANTVFFAVPGMKAETAQIAFDLAGVALSAGSACSSGRTGPSHVLKAMGHGDHEGALRVSIGYQTSAADVDLFEEALRATLARRTGRADEAA